MSLADFVAQFLPQAQAASANTGLPVDYILAQSALETGSGTSNAAVNGNNYFGISPGGSLATYSTPDASFGAYSDLINSGYSNASMYSGGNVSQIIGDNTYAADQIAQSMNGNGYSTNPNYAASVASLIPGVDAALSQLGATTGASATASGTTSGTTQTSAANCGNSVGCYVTAATTWIGKVAVQGTMIVIGLILLLGALYMFGRKGMS